MLSPYVEGFSVSSPFEAKLVREVIGSSGIVHIVTPGYKLNEMKDIASVADYISFNSLSQWERFSGWASECASCGLRINPQLSFVEDKRYNPCRKHSKLGVPLSKLASISNNGSGVLRGLKGILFHTYFESTIINHLLKTGKHLDAHIPRIL